MTIEQLVALNARTGDAMFAIVTMRAHVEPTPGSWRVIAVAQEGSPPVAIEARDSSLPALIDAIEELHRRWTAAMKRSPS